MQKVIHVNYSGNTPYTERLQTLNSYLEQGWNVVQTQPVCQVIADSRCQLVGDYGVTFIIQKD